MKDFSQYAQAELEKELITNDFHGKEIKHSALVEIMTRMYQMGKMDSDIKINKLIQENSRLTDGTEVIGLRNEVVRLRIQVNENATKYINSLFKK